MIKESTTKFPLTLIWPDDYRKLVARISLLSMKASEFSKKYPVSRHMHCVEDIRRLGYTVRQKSEFRHAMRTVPSWF